MPSRSKIAKTHWHLSYRAHLTRRANARSHLYPHRAATAELWQRAWKGSGLANLPRKDSRY